MKLFAAPSTNTRSKYVTHTSTAKPWSTPVHSSCAKQIPGVVAPSRMGGPLKVDAGGHSTTVGCLSGSRHAIAGSAKSETDIVGRPTVPRLGVTCTEAPMSPAHALSRLSGSLVSACAAPH